MVPSSFIFEPQYVIKQQRRKEDISCHETEPHPEEHYCCQYLVCRQHFAVPYSCVKPYYEEKSVKSSPNVAPLQFGVEWKSCILSIPFSTELKG